MWKDIPGYEGLYKINEYGDIKNINTGKLKITRKPDDYYAYPYVILYKDAKQKKHGIHRLVAKSFIPNPDNLPIVMHKDNNKLNYYKDNLKWGTASENTLDAIRDGLSYYPTTFHNYYEIYNDNGKVHEICEGYEGVIEKIGYGTEGTIISAVYNKSKFSKGPYKGCKVCKIIFENEK